MNNSQQTHSISQFKSTFLYIFSFTVCDHGSLGEDGLYLAEKGVELHQQAQVLFLSKRIIVEKKILTQCKE